MAALDFRGQTVWVTGAGKGIGYATALAFVEAGANVTGFDLAFDGESYPFATETLDVADADQAKGAVNHTSESIWITDSRRADAFLLAFPSVHSLRRFRLRLLWRVQHPCEDTQPVLHGNPARSLLPTVRLARLQGLR